MLTINSIIVLWQCFKLWLLSTTGYIAAEYASGVAQATRRTKLRTRRSGELVRAPCDLEHRAIKFVIVEFP